MSIRCLLSLILGRAGDESLNASRTTSTAGYNFEAVLGGLSEEDVDVMRLRDENDLLMQSLVKNKLEMAEMQSAPRLSVGWAPLTTH